MKSAVQWLIPIALLALSNTRCLPGDEPAPRGSRAFRLDYGCRLTGFAPGAKVGVWLPVPRTDGWQSVDPLPAELPGPSEFHIEPKFCNRILYCEFSAEDEAVTINVPYRIVRRAVFTAAELRPANDERNECHPRRDLFLKPDALVPIDGKPLELFNGRPPIGTPRQRARSIYDLVSAHVTYDKTGNGWGRGDVLWVCDSRRGNCSDFHSLFISLARSQGIPAKFEVGFPIPAGAKGEIAGYHCWAWFESEEGKWLPVDISEADKLPDWKDFYFGRLTADRVAFSVGRDIDLVPKQDGPPLNFFIYPHVEVDGKPLPPDQLRMQIGYRDLRPAGRDAADDPSQ